MKRRSRSAAGNGGDGIVAWRREKYVPKGGPAGGDGGHGGSVFLEATPELSTLVEFRFKRSFAAESGKAGGTSNKSGRSGDDLTILVPVGTLVYRTLRGQARDLSGRSSDARRTHAGRQGRPRRPRQPAFRDQRRAKRRASPKRASRANAARLRLELRLLADCGIVGVPNAGKSTLLSVVSAARPKIADYPFTTLEPQLGVVRVSDEESFVMVDVPGLIEGAHEGAGLGDQFLAPRRTHARAGALARRREAARRNRCTTKTTIEHELGAWNPKLLEKPTLLVRQQARSCPTRANVSSSCANAFPTCAASARRPAKACKTWCTPCGARSSTRRCPKSSTPPPAHIELAPHDAFTIERDQEGAFVVCGERIERLAAMTDFDSDEGLARFERALAKMGVEKKLRELGAVEGDTVRIGPYEFTYS